MLAKVFPIKLKDGNQAAAEAIVQEFAPRGPGAEEGTLSFRVYRDPAKPDYLLFVDEAPLDHVRGTSGFAERFSAQGPRDSKGRSLRDLDLRQRLMRYPCSYVVYSAVFDGLPESAREMVLRRMKRILAGEERAPRYAHLAASRQAVLEILRETKKNLPAWF